MKTFIEMYNEGWCNSCDRLNTGECSKENICKAYEEFDKFIKKINKDKEAQNGEESV